MDSNHKVSFLLPPTPMNQCFLSYTSISGKIMNKSVGGIEQLYLYPSFLLCNIFFRAWLVIPLCNMPNVALKSSRKKVFTLLEFFLWFTVVLCYSSRQFKSIFATTAPTTHTEFSILCKGISRKHIQLVLCTTLYSFNFIHGFFIF